MFNKSVIISFSTIEKMLCSNCNSMKTELWCRKCEANYCSSCYEIVHAPPILKTHVSIPIDQKPVTTVTCNQHPDEKLQFWCNTCQVLVCSDCMLDQHQGHSCNGIEKEAVTKASEVRTRSHAQTFHKKMFFFIV